jgi:hypothetical protein
MRVGAEAISQLTLLSDLAPGTRFGNSESYWTGFPLPQLNRYALLRTWPAPEMPRPGCVWTQALIFETPVFDELGDLYVLSEMTRRPQGVLDRSSYTSAIDFDLRQSAFRSDDLKTNQLVDILHSLYGEAGDRVLVDEPGELDREVFAIWSQQWPRLRRNFRFQTAAIIESGAPRSRFDLSFVTRKSHVSRDNAQPYEFPADWVAVALADLTSGSADGLRTFLWRYGIDVKRQRGSFRPLCTTFVQSMDLSYRLEVVDCLERIPEWFPEKDDAAKLKQDIADGQVPNFSQLDLLFMLLKGDGSKSLWLPSVEGEARLARLWPGRANEMLKLANTAISQDSDLARSVASLIFRVIPKANLWSNTENFPNIRQRVIQDDPFVLDAPELASFSPIIADEMIRLVPVDHPVGARLVHRFLDPRAELAQIILRHFPIVSVAELLSLANEGRVSLQSTWFKGLAREKRLVLASQVPSMAQRTSILYRLAEILDWLSPEVLKAGVHAWAKGVRSARQDLPAEEYQTLAVFLISLAIATGGGEAEYICEKFFSLIHERIMRSYLPWRATEILESRLPDLGWRKNWDVGLRFRLAVAQAYIRFHLDTRSFAALSDDPGVRDRLYDAASNLEGGQPYADSLELRRGQLGPW